MPPGIHKISFRRQSPSHLLFKLLLPSLGGTPLLFRKEMFKLYKLKHGSVHHSKANIILGHEKLHKSYKNCVVCSLIYLALNTLKILFYQTCNITGQAFYLNSCRAHYILMWVVILNFLRKRKIFAKNTLKPPGLFRNSASVHKSYVIGILFYLLLNKKKQVFLT